MPEKFDPSLMSRHAVREAKREKITLDMIKSTYEDPDSVRVSDLVEVREIRTKFVGDEGLEVVVDTQDRRVVTVWRKGQK